MQPGKDRGREGREGERIGDRELSEGEKGGKRRKERRKREKERRERDAQIYTEGSNLVGEDCFHSGEGRVVQIEKERENSG